MVEARSPAQLQTLEFRVMELTSCLAGAGSFTRDSHYYRLPWIRGEHKCTELFLPLSPMSPTVPPSATNEMLTGERRLGNNRITYKLQRSRGKTGNGFDNKQATV